MIVTIIACISIFFLVFTLHSHRNSKKKEAIIDFLKENLINEREKNLEKISYPPNFPSWLVEEFQSMNKESIKNKIEIDILEIEINNGGFLGFRTSV